MTRWARTALWCAALAACAAGQEVEMLRQRISYLEDTIRSQRDEFASRLAELERRLDEPRDERVSEISDRIDEVQKRVGGMGQILRRPLAGSSTPTADIFTALQGGLILTGLFRTRFEARTNNIDLNDSGRTGLDDSGLRFNGRFRLGFGAMLLPNPDGTAPQITALTEFQSVGSFANNTYLSIPSAAGAPVPVSFNLFIEPFEVVSLYQGYVAFQRLIHETINVKVGRQEIALGNELMLGNNSFQDGTVHDSALVQWVPSDDLTVTTFYSKEAGADLSLGSSRSDFDEDEMAGIYAEYQPKRNLAFDAYALYFNARSLAEDTFVTGSTAFMFDNSYRPPIFGHFWTLGVRALVADIHWCRDVITLNGECAWQFGDDDRSISDPPLDLTREIRGMCAEALVNYRFNPKSDGLRPIVTAGYYYAQGGDGLVSGDFGFQPLFVNRHFENSQRDEREDVFKPYYPGGGRYGNMDILPLANVHILKGALSVALTDRIELGAGYLYAITADDEGYGTGTFGQEIDLFASYIPRDNVQFSANLSLFLPGKTATALSDLLFFDRSNLDNVPRAGNDLATTFYLQALIQF